jgi:hypothetical protein
VDGALATFSIGSLVCMAFFTVMGGANGTIVCTGLAGCKTGKCCTQNSPRYAGAPVGLTNNDFRTYGCGNYWALKCKFPWGYCGGATAEPETACGS